jgi:arylsulfatase
MKRRHAVITVAVAAAVVAILLIIWPLAPQRPSIILISVDTLRPDHLGCYGYARDTSPNVDGFARESLLYRRCFAQAPTTRPSCGTIISGYFPHELKIFSNRDAMPAPVTTVAERLRENGYATIGVVSNFVLRKGGGFEQGFDYYDDQMDEVELVRGVPERIAEKTTDTAISLLRIHHDETFFMWIHYQDPHGPYTPGSPYNTMFTGGENGAELPFNDTVSGKGGIPSYQRLGDVRDLNYYVAQYDGEIRYFDTHFKRLLDELKALDLYDKALIIFTSDHGEGMGEHDYYFAHGEYVYNTLIHVPLIIRFGRERQGEIDEFAQLADIVPTILGSADIKTGPEYHGSDLLTGAPAERYIFSEMPGKYAVFKGDLKLVYHAESDEYLLFDVTSDPYENSDLLPDSEHAGRIGPMVARMMSFREQDVLGSTVRRRTPAISKEEKEKLKALGYVQ